MGIPRELFINPDNIDEKFICSICLEVMNHPVLTLPCEHMYCKSCIQIWHKTTKNCPMDRVVVTNISGPQRAFLNLYKRLPVRCVFYNLGCQINMELGDFKKHQSSCEYNLNLVKPCPAHCGALIKKCECWNHNCISYLKGIIAQYKNEVQIKNEEIKTLQVKIQYNQDIVDGIANEVEKFMEFMERIAVIFKYGVKFGIIGALLIFCILFIFSKYK